MLTDANVPWNAFCLALHDERAKHGSVGISYGLDQKGLLLWTLDLCRHTEVRSQNLTGFPAGSHMLFRAPAFCST